MRRLKKTEVAAARNRILATQHGKCMLCMRKIRIGEAALDHDHSTGAIRSVLCLNCNSMEGKILNRVKRAKGVMTVIEWAQRLIKYWQYHATSRHGLLHHTHTTADEKRIAKNAKARKRAAIKRAAKKR